MIRYTRGTRVPISTVFYNSTGGIMTPTTVTITIAYPTGSTTSDWPFDGTDLATTTVTMSTPLTTAGTYTTTWDSAISGNGVVYWTAVPSTDSFYQVNEGKFELRGGLANPTAVPTTL